MSNDTKQRIGELSPGLRVTSLAISAIAPILNLLLTRKQDEDEEVVNQPVLVVDQSEDEDDDDSDEKPSFLSSLEDLRSYVLQQELLKRGSDLGSDLVARGSKLSQSVVSHGSDLTHDLVERGSKLSQTVASRGSDLGDELTKRSKKAQKKLNKQTARMSKKLNKQKAKVGKELNKRSKQVQNRFSNDTLSENRNLLLTVLGFSIGLVAAGVGVYFFLRKRAERVNEAEDEHILISHNGHTNGQVRDTRPAGEIHTVSNSGGIVPTTSSTVSSDETRASSSPAIASVGSTPSLDRPTDAAFLGLSSTRRYYPVQTPLEQLTDSSEPADIIYFSSEAEARAQGFSAAE